MMKDGLYFNEEYDIFLWEGVKRSRTHWTSDQENWTRYQGECGQFESTQLQTVSFELPMEYLT